MAAKKPVLALAGVARVNLLPKVEIERRERASLTRTWVLLAIAALAVGVLIIAGMFTVKLMADQRLAAEQARTTELIGELAGYADVSKAIATRTALESFRTKAMSNDLAWVPMLAKVTGALPEGTALMEYSLAPGGAPVGGDPALGVGALGSLTLTAKTAAAQAAAVAALAAVPGVKIVDAGELYTAGDAGFEFVVTIAFDQSVYSGRYAAEGSK